MGFMTAIPIYLLMTECAEDDNSNRFTWTFNYEYIHGILVVSINYE